MISVLATWSLVAALFGSLLAGLGLAVRRAVGVPIATGLVLPLGFSTLVVIGAFASMLGVPPAPVLVVVVPLAVWGLAGLWPARRTRPGADLLWGGAAVGLTWLIYVAVVASTGQPTFGGYNIIGDPVIHLVGADAILGGGGDWASRTGSFKAFFEGYYGNGYPVGGASMLALLSALTTLEPLKTLHPLLAMSMAVFASATWVLLTPVIAARWLRAAASVLVAFPALTFSFVLMSSLKEVVAIAALASTCAACTVLWPRADASVPDGDGRTEAAEDADAATSRAAGLLGALRTTIPVAIPVAALVAAIGPAAVVYAGPAFVVILLGAFLTGGWRFAATHAVLTVVAALLLVIPSLVDLSGYLAVSGTVLTSQVELGNLYLGPIDEREILGIWLGPDFRLPPRVADYTHNGGTLVIVLAIVGGLRTLQIAAQRVPRVIPLVAWMLTTAVATKVIIDTGSPWADAKALAIAAPTVMAGATVGVAALWVSRWTRIVAVAAGVAVAGGVAWSIALVSYDLTVVADDRFTELRKVDQQFAGQGPMITAEWEEFVRHSLRHVPGTFGADGYVGLGFTGPYGISGDQDDFALEETQKAKLMLVRSGPAASRPPSNYSRVWTGRWYEVWKRSETAPAPVKHLGLGSVETGGAAVPRCADVEALIKSAGPGDEIVAAERRRVVTQLLGKLPLPVAWNPDGSDPRVLRPYGRGDFSFTLRAPGPGAEVDVWWEGSFNRADVVIANGKRATVGPQALNSRRSATRVMTVKADAAGQVKITVQRPGRALRAGGGNANAVWGPVSITPHDPLAAEKLLRVDPKDARAQLCGRALDWIEVVPGS